MGWVFYTLLMKISFFFNKNLGSLFGKEKGWKWKSFNYNRVRFVSSVQLHWTRWYYNTCPLLNTRHYLDRSNALHSLDLGLTYHRLLSSVENFVQWLISKFGRFTCSSSWNEIKAKYEEFDWLELIWQLTSILKHFGLLIY